MADKRSRNNANIASSDELKQVVLSGFDDEKRGREFKKNRQDLFGSNNDLYIK